MNIRGRLDQLERRADSMRGPEIPAALIRYGDGTETTVKGFYEGVTRALAGGVESITGDDADFTALLRALTGTL